MSDPIFFSLSRKLTFNLNIAWYLRKKLVSQSVKVEKCYIIQVWYFIQRNNK